MCLAYMCRQLKDALLGKVQQEIAKLSTVMCSVCSSSEFNTSVDIELHKWADSLQLAQLCANVRMFFL